MAVNCKNKSNGRYFVIKMFMIYIVFDEMPVVNIM